MGHKRRSTKGPRGKQLAIVSRLMRGYHHSHADITAMTASLRSHRRGRSRQQVCGLCSEASRHSANRGGGRAPAPKARGFCAQIRTLHGSSLRGLARAPGKASDGRCRHHRHSRPVPRCSCLGRSRIGLSGSPRKTYGHKRGRLPIPSSGVAQHGMRPPLSAHVLRYTEFFKTVKEAIDTGPSGKSIRSCMPRTSPTITWPIPTFAAIGATARCPRLYPGQVLPRPRPHQVVRGK